MSQQFHVTSVYSCLTSYLKTRVELFYAKRWPSLKRANALLVQVILCATGEAQFPMIHHCLGLGRSVSSPAHILYIQISYSVMAYFHKCCIFVYSYFHKYLPAAYKHYCKSNRNCCGVFFFRLELYCRAVFFLRPAFQTKECHTSNSASCLSNTGSCFPVS